MEQEIRKLIDGFARFRARHFGGADGVYSRLRREGQSPRTMIIACCDSRVDPAIVTDCDPGDLFVVRNVANLVPPCETQGHYHGTSAALEFAVQVVGVRHVIVLGHARCGGIDALVRGIKDEGVGQFLKPWMAIAQEARDAAPARLDDARSLRAVEQAAVRVSLRNLLTFPWVEARVAAGELQLHGWYFDLDQGELLRYDSAQDRYVPLA